jgi:hypothetical protein
VSSGPLSSEDSIRATRRTREPPVVTKRGHKRVLVLLARFGHVRHRHLGERVGLSYPPPGPARAVAQALGARRQTIRTPGSFVASAGVVRYVSDRPSADRLPYRRRRGEPPPPEVFEGIAALSGNPRTAREGGAHRGRCRVCPRAAGRWTWPASLQAAARTARAGVKRRPRDKPGGGGGLRAERASRILISAERGRGGEGRGEDVFTDFLARTCN